MKPYVPFQSRLLDTMISTGEAPGSRVAMLVVWVFLLFRVLFRFGSSSAF